VHLFCAVALAEIVFYSTHRLMHASNWLWTHVHYMHHEWHAPIACCCIYAHPIEFMMGNIPVVLMGPLLLGSHLSVWTLWAVLGVADTCIVHSGGWHFPLLSSPEGHDYHHSSGFIDNLGVMGL
jgi:fatty acid hydroxylase domain-containing protein 2